MTMEPDWLPIETAPKDGTWAELLDPQQFTPERRVTLRQWRLWQKGSSNPIFEEHWVDQFGQVRPSATYTHWRPAKPPENEQGSDAVKGL